MTAAGGAVPFARAVVIVRGRGFDGDMEKDRLHVAPVQTRARQRYRALSHYVAATLHRSTLDFSQNTP